MILQSLIVELGLNIANLRKDFNYAAREVEKFTTGATRAFKGLGYGIGTYLGGQQLISFGKSVFEAGLETQRLEYAFLGITGSAQGAARELDFLLNTSQKLGMNFQVTAQAFKSLSAAAIDTSMEGQGVHDIFTAVSEASVALSLNAEQTSATLYALEQMISKGVVSMEELRRQMGNQLPGAFNMAAKAMNMTTREFNKFVKEGNLMTDEFMPKFATVLHERFARPAQLAAQNAQQELNRLSNAWFLLRKNLGDAGGFDIAVGAIRELGNILNWWSSLLRGSQSEWDKFVKKMSGRTTEEQIKAEINRLEAELPLLKKRTWNLRAMPKKDWGIVGGGIGTQEAQLAKVEARIAAIKQQIIEAQNILKAGYLETGISQSYSGFC